MSYSPLTHKDGPVRPLASTIAEREGVTPEMVLLAWAKLKGAIVLTTSRKDWRLADYLRAGDVALTPVDEASIDAAGAAEEVAVAQEEKAAVKVSEKAVDEKAVDEKAFLAAIEAAELGGVDELVSCPSHTTRERKLHAATFTFKVLLLMCCAYMFWRI
jgi:4-hydroxy-L-threonine phosphate dehydrogenase PdxA